MAIQNSAACKVVMKRQQQGDAGAAVLVIMIVLMGVWFWHGDRWHGGERGHMSRPVSTATPEKTALDLLDEAYARGDISREEYLRKRDDQLRR